MEKCKTEAFGFPSFAIYCFGKLDAVNMVIQYFALHTEKDDLDLNVFVSRIVDSGLEAYAEGKNFKGKLNVRDINKYFKENGKLLSPEKYHSMVFFWKPDYCAEELGLTERQKALMMDYYKSIYYPDEDFDWREEGFFPEDTFEWTKENRLSEDEIYRHKKLKI